MWRTMMRVWLVGAVVTIGALDGFPEPVDHPPMVRAVVDGGETLGEEVGDVRPGMDIAAQTTAPDADLV